MKWKGDGGKERMRSL